MKVPTLLGEGSTVPCLPFRGWEPFHRREDDTRRSPITTQSPTRVYIAFDFQDRNLAQLMGGQLRREGTGYDVANWSLKEARPEAEWETDAEYHIKRSHLLMIVLGSRTYRASGVLKEVAIARRPDVNVPCCQIAPSALREVRPVPNGGRWYRWTHENLDKLIARAQREL